jgi:hypothetical protein
VCNNSAWATVWEYQGEGSIDAEVDIDEALAALTSPAIYAYYVRVSFMAIGQSTAAGLAMVRMESDLQMSQTSLPALSVGSNLVSVDTDNREAASGDMRLRISHGWDESPAPPPPSPPRRAVAPGDGERVAARTLCELVWENDDTAAVADHHVIVSDRADFLMPVSPNFDRLTFSPTPRWKVSRSFLRPGSTYYWKVRSRSEEGAWSDWGPTWRFTVEEHRDE